MAGGLAVPGLASLTRVASAFGDPPAPRNAWIYEKTLVTRAASTLPGEQTLWSTIMRVDNKLAAPLDRYYLWVSTHDCPILRLYTAPSIEGPWRERRLSGL